ncbi:sigma-70 family RNA polymerase sigma factor [Chitinophaga sp.]|uniref:sigma-70 family RNA polymerase sigma factor n=1 Tax=Chitinophaga sp. TaxID=1869181 RepID=UPI002CD2B1F7|nr:sigma-70 family RNA polymerase sigma factor [Chitinophaga sp.]HWV67286.1 sigma-70 family RNA polymerase sigma factor [Chitinophaga sp.]
MKHVSEQDLLQMIRDSDYAAFEELHHRYYSLLYTMAAKKTGDRDEAYDLVQNMFIELWEKRADFTITNTLEAWLKNRVWFKLSGYFRAKGLREKHLHNFSLFLQQKQTVYIPETELQEITAQYDTMIAVINRTVEDMPVKMREVFLLSRQEDHSIAAIAVMLGISPKTVKNHINIAFKRIRKAVAQSSLPMADLLLMIWLMQA